MDTYVSTFNLYQILVFCYYSLMFFKKEKYHLEFKTL